MQIAIVNSTTTYAFTPVLADEARRVAAPGTTVEAVQVRFGPASIEGYVDEELAAFGVLDAIGAHGATYDGYVLSCYGDPGLYAARELSPVPVVGVGEASLHLASLVAHRFSIITILDRFLPAVRDMVRRTGLDSRVGSIRATGIAVLDAERDPEATAKAVVREAQLAIKSDGAEAICLGCSGFSGLEQRVREAVGVPVVDGLAAAVKLVEALVTCGLGTSRAGAFMEPEDKVFVLPNGVLPALGTHGRP